MFIREMTRDACFDFLRSASMGRIACVRDSQPYITPFSFVLDDEFLVGFATVGRKIAWMRENPRVCVEVDAIVSRDEWQTVVVLGHYEELTDTPQYKEKREAAHRILAKTASWWEPGYVETLGQSMPRSREPVLFRISIDELSGHRASPSVESVTAVLT